MYTMFQLLDDTVQLGYVLTLLLGAVVYLMVERRRILATPSARKLDGERPRILRVSEAVPASEDSAATSEQSKEAVMIPKKKMIYKVVLTGGPCAGKSTGLAHIRATLEKEGFQIYVVPEAATLLIDGGAGIALRDGQENQVFNFQLALLKMQLLLEDSMCNIAEAMGKPAVILCDRGALDGRAFCTPELWENILREGNWSTPQLRDSRYDLVIHLVTAAAGAREYYTTANNTARSETPDEAVQQDQQLREAWLGHPKHRIITNEPDQPFQEKLDRATLPICQLINIRSPSALAVYQLNYTPPTITLPKSVSLVTVTILRGSNKECVYTLYHKQEPDGHGATCSYQILKRNKRKLSSQTTEKVTIHRTEEFLSTNVYNSMLSQRDPCYEVIKKTITTFVENDIKYELEQVAYPPMVNQCLLLVEEERAPVPSCLSATDLGSIQRLTNLDSCVAATSLPNPIELESCLIPASPELSISSPALSQWHLTRGDSFALGSTFTRNHTDGTDLLNVTRKYSVASVDSVVS
eukprot:TRINITY_DN14592_c0_g1_i1.p1 TRINITY_DN14592_c0_g1~~TRINITY_DN14592_c0_g1_i1.p1  ORF type:complete len:525 (+),score=105.53 TRINITY_DN14592_c0_g1_i1:25-1599(+)